MSFKLKKAFSSLVRFLPPYDRHLRNLHFSEATQYITLNLTLPTMTQHVHKTKRRKNSTKARRHKQTPISLRALSDVTNLLSAQGSRNMCQQTRGDYRGYADKTHCKTPLKQCTGTGYQRWDNSL